MIDYTALSMVSQRRIHFRFKLEGQDPNWREVVNDRNVSIRTSRPATTASRVIACNNSSMWNEEGAALDFVIPPAWYQTNWFRAACVAAFLAMVPRGIYKLRVRQLAAQFNMRLEEQFVSERTRILRRDLHDTLLPKLHGVLLYFQTGINQLPEHPANAGPPKPGRHLRKQ